MRKAIRAAKTAYLYIIALRRNFAPSDDKLAPTAHFTAGDTARPINSPGLMATEPVLNTPYRTRLRRKLVKTGMRTGAVYALFFVVLVLSFASISIYARVAQAAPNNAINFQARILTASGSVVADGNYSVEFKIYNTPTGGFPEWNDTFVLSAKNGYITTSLGSGAPFSGTIDWSQEHWLTMNINGDGEMGPNRMKITAVPYAFTAGKALNVFSANTASASTNSNSISVQTGNATGSSSNSGNITVDSGTATGTTGTVSIGSINASGVTIGRLGLQTNIAGTALISGGVATLGTATQAGSLVLNDGNGGQTTTLQAGNSAGNLSFTLPTTTGAALECLQNSATPGVLQFGACGAGGGTLQSAYDNSVGGIITATATDGAFRVRDAATTFGNGNVFAVQNNAGAVDYLAVQGDGDVAIDTNTLFVDATNNRVGIGTAAPTSVLQVTNAAPVSVVTATGTAQIAVANFAGGIGGSTTIATTGAGGAGGAFTVTGGAGGQATAATTSSTGGAGGAVNLNGGAGGAAAVAGTGNNIGGAGGAFSWTAGTGGNATGATSGNNTGGNGGAIALQAGTGGTATTGTGGLNGGNGGALTLSGGTGGVGVTSGGNGGLVTIQGGTAAAMAGAAGGGVTVSGRAGSATGSGGNGGALSLTAGSAGGDNSVNRTGGAVTITAGASRGASAGGAISITAGTGGNNLTVGTATGGSSGGITLSGGNGGTAPNATVSSIGGTASGISFSGGTGGAASVAGTGNNTGGAGGTSTLTGGNGGIANGATTGTNTGGNGGGFTLQGGTGGAANTGTGNNIGGTGGALTLSGGTGGVGVTSGGNGGLVTIQGGTAAAMAGAAGGGVSIAGRAGSTTASGGAGGTLSMSAGNAGGNNTVARLGGAVSITAGNSTGGAAGGAVTVTAGSGGSNLTAGTATGGNAGGITFNGGNGSTAPNATVSSTGGTAGGFTINGGTGGAASVAGTGNNTGGNGGAFTWSAGNGGTANGATSGINTGGAGGTITLLAGSGGSATTGTGTLQGGAGGGLILQAGTGGAGTVAGAGGALTLRGGTSSLAGGDIILQTSPTTTLTERMRVTNSGYVGIGTGTGTALPNARLTVVAENTTTSQIKLRSQNAAIVANSVIGGLDFDSNDTSLTAPGLTSARIQAIATATHTAAVTDTALIFSTASGTTLAERWRISATGELQGNGASLVRANSGNLTVGTVTSGNIILDGAGTVEVQDNININGTQLTNNGSTVNGVLAIGNIAVNGNIGTAATTVDIKTAFNVAQTTTGRTLTLPTPTQNSVAGRLAFVTNTGSTSFTMHGVVIANGASQSYIYNGATWISTNVGGGGSGVNTVGTIDSQTKSADGAVISGTTLYLQTADSTNPGLLSAGLQTIGGDKTFTGNVQVDGTISGNGSGLTSLNASQISSGTVADAYLSANVTLLGNSFNAANQLVRLDAGGLLPSLNGSALTNLNAANLAGNLPALNGSALTSLNASNISSGTLDNSRLNSSVTILGNTVNAANGLVQLDATGKLTSLDGSALTNLSSANLNGALPALNGSALTSLNANNISSGTIDDLRLSSNVTVMGNSFNTANQLVKLDASGNLPTLNGAAITNISASNISSGTIDSARLDSTVTRAGNSFNTADNLVLLDASSKLPSLDASALTSLNANNISSGTIDDSRLSSNVTLKGNSFNAANQLVLLDAGGALPALNGSALTSLNAGNITSGTIDDLRLSTNVTTMGNTFNTSNKLVQLDASGNLPALNGSALTSLNASNISSGTLDNSRLNSSVTILGNTVNAANGLVQLDATGKLTSLDGSALTNLSSANLNGALPALNGSALTSLNANNISSGTIDDLRLSSNVTVMGNSFNTANQLVKLDASGNLPTLNGAALTSLNASNVSSGTIGDGRLSSNITRLSAAQAFTAQQAFESNITIGTDTASPNAGLIAFNDATGSNGFTASIGVNGGLTANRNLYIPDESGTICVAGSTACGFIVLGGSTAQLDNTNNPSIFINKGITASGNLMTLQKNGATVYSVLKSGALQLALTDASAFTVSGAGGTTQFFDVDTTGSGLVQIGGSAADNIATLLVLDTKNTAGDPTGVNGGSYYNSAEGKNRCFEGGVWADCSTLRLAGETTLGAASGTINLSLNGNYEYLECRVDVKGRSAASIPYVRFNNNTGAAAYGWNAYGIVTTAGTDWQDASDSEIQLSGTQTGTNPFSANLKITNYADTDKVVDWTASGLEAVGTNSNRYSGVGGFYNTSNQITSVQFVLSAGTFNAGSHAWCQGKNVR